ncbi:MAG: response regulator [Alphaproteobacteria bacterium]|nr:response regulator [Alphaproteobacteria bacterium]
MKRVMIVDDNKDLSDMICEILRRENYEVTAKYDGEQAIESLAAGDKYDLVLTDIIMPEQDGYDVLNYIRKEKLGIPVIVMSGGGAVVAVDEILLTAKAFACDILSKPIQFDELTDKVKKWA